MTTKKPEWDHIRVFLALARTGSLRAASQELGVSQPTVYPLLKTLSVSCCLIAYPKDCA